MKKCKKCQQTNEVTARFCWQCGSRLSTSLPALNIPLPKAQLQPLKHRKSAPAEEIAHPEQKSEAIPRKENQGQRLSPDLNRKLQENLKKIRKPKAALKTPSNPPRKSLLGDKEKAVIQRGLKKKLPFEAQPAQAFSMKKAETLTRHKEEIHESHQKEQKLEEDLAFLDEMFAGTKTRKKVRPVKQKQTEPEPKPQPAKDTAPPKEEPLVAFETQDWLSTVKNQRQIPPSEMLNGARNHQTPEFMTPVLTAATFLYFVYVLYI